MNFLRLLIVVIVVTACGGSFGAIVGGLIGYAIPETLGAFFNIEKEEIESHTLHQREHYSASATVGGVGSTDGSNWNVGAAIGGAWGLILGSMAGLGIGVVDQILVALLRWVKSRSGDES